MDLEESGISVWTGHFLGHPDTNLNRGKTRRGPLQMKADKKTRTSSLNVFPSVGQDLMLDTVLDSFSSLESCSGYESNTKCQPESGTVPQLGFVLLRSLAVRNQVDR